jgi:hypothetical protein
MSFDSEEIIETMNKLMLLSKRFGDYSLEADRDAYSAADQFARALFVWRKPVPKFRHAAVCQPVPVLFRIIRPACHSSVYDLLTFKIDR